MKINKITVLGAGNFGTAFATLLSSHGYPVVMWGIMEDVVDEINRRHTNTKFLPEVKLSPYITATLSLEDALRGAQIVFFAVPSQVVKKVAEQSAPFLDDQMVIVSLAKGLETTSLRRMSEIMLEVVGDKKVAVLSGPSYGRELAQRLPTSVVVASKDPEVGRLLQTTLTSDYFYVQLSDDLIGLELAGAFKNMVALASGMLAGMGLGENARAALIIKGFNEIKQLSEEQGAREESLMGLAGLGDLILTCTSKQSRNFRAGSYLGKGYSLAEANDKVGMVVEGVEATKAAYSLMQKKELTLPLITYLYRVIEGTVTIDGLKPLVLSG